MAAMISPLPRNDLNTSQRRFVPDNYRCGTACSVQLLVPLEGGVMAASGAAGVLPRLSPGSPRL
jgi:hypothetical protein